MNAFTTVDPALRTRRAKSDHEPWRPKGFHARGVEFLQSHAAAALFWDPGLGKTSTVLEAFRQLKEAGQVDRMLVVAPLRVCQLVWRQEGRKWTQFRDLTFSFLHGPKKEERLRDDVDIHLINPEGIPWLAQQFFGRSDIPWDVVCIDELTKFKNARTPRFKKLHKKIRNVRYRWGLTGTPAPNGYLDLFGQLLMLDDGAALGKYITHYRDRYFQPDFNGFKWNLRKGCAEKIEERIAPYALRMSAEDYLELPDLSEIIVPVTLPPDALRAYREMEKETIVSLPGGVVTAANSGAVYSKLKQMANGAVYVGDGSERKVLELHSAKLDALEELIDELAGQPLLVAYEFQHDLSRIRARLGEDTPALAGASEKRAIELEAQWNRGELPILLVHPASVGHGLNLQRAAGVGTAHLCWFSLPWDLELYDQTIRRLRRQGSTADRVVSHMLMIDIHDGMDLYVYEALQGKDTTQQRLLSALNAVVMRDDPAPHATGNVASTEDTDMAAEQKLGFRKPGAAAPAAAEPAKRITPKGWGATNIADDEDLPPAGESVMDEVSDTTQRSAFEDSQPPATSGKVTPRGWGAAVPSEPDEQRAAIRSKIAAPPAQEPEGGEEEDEGESVAQRALQAFGPGIVEQLGGEDGEEQGEPEPHPKAQALSGGASTEPEKPKTRRSRKAQSEKQSPDEQKSQQDEDELFERQTAALEAAGRAASTGSTVTLPAAAREEYPYVRFSLECSGIPREGLAAFFAALAAQFGEAK